MKDINKFSIDKRLDNLADDNSAELLARAIHTYVNYQELANKAENNDSVMKESREHYEYIILRELENIFKGKEKVEIALKIFPLFD